MSAANGASVTPVSSLPSATLRYLSRADVEALDLPGLAVVEIMERAFADKRANGVELPPKIGIHPREDAFIHAMPAYLGAQDVAGIKWVSGYPTNRAHPGVPYLHGLLVLSDAETGAPRCIMDATWVTEVRTAAVSVLGIHALLAREPASVAIIGCGRQGLAHLDLISRAFPTVAMAYLHDPDAAAAERLRTFIGDRLDVRVGGLAEAAAEADIVVTCAPIVKHPARPLLASAVTGDAVVCAVDFDATLDAELVRAAGVFVVDDVPQYRHYMHQGHFGGYPDDPHELCDVLADRPAIGSGPRVYAPLGIALADIAVGARLYDAAESAGIGVSLPIWSSTQPDRNA
jgi:alanine dehydrogenase